MDRIVIKAETQDAGHTCVETQVPAGQDNQYHASDSSTSSLLSGPLVDDIGGGSSEFETQRIVVQLPVQGSLTPLFRAFDLAGEGEGWTEDEGHELSSALTMQVSVCITVHQPIHPISLYLRSLITSCQYLFPLKT